MKDNKFDEKLQQVANAYQTTPDRICSEMALVIKEGQQSQDPQVRALWDAVPRSGTTLTLEDFVEYLAETLPRPYLS